MGSQSPPAVELLDPVSLCEILHHDVKLRKALSYIYETEPAWKTELLSPVSREAVRLLQTSGIHSPDDSSDEEPPQRQVAFTAPEP